jgi:cytochrome bd ubiquinol oxidase subunit II
MALADVPMVFLLAGLVAYTVLAGADFGAGLWQLGAGRGERGEQVRGFAHHAMAPVWEANHVWLIFVLVVCWTAYPEAFGSIASTLAVPFFLAAIGIILRGTSYALRSVGPLDRREPAIRRVFALSSLLTPFALGAAVGAIAARRVPVGNARGDLLSSWLAATPILIGALAVATGAYLAAVYLAADARRAGRDDLVEPFRARALGAGLVAGALAIGGLAVLRADVRPLFDGLTSGAGLAAVAVSVLAGVGTLALVWRERYEAARYMAALAVAAIVVGWGIAQEPTLLPGLTVHEAAAEPATLRAVLIGVGIGFVVLAPSLGLLFGLVLRGRFDEEAAPAPAPAPATSPRTWRRVGTAAPATLLAAGALLTILGEGMVLGAGVVVMLLSSAWVFATLMAPGSAQDSTPG